MRLVVLNAIIIENLKKGYEAYADLKNITFSTLMCCWMTQVPYLNCVMEMKIGFVTFRFLQSGFFFKRFLKQVEHSTCMLSRQLHDP
jgi:hypothetical protein